MDKIQQIKMQYIVADSEQPRQEFEPAALRRLAGSIKQQGILTPLALERQGDTFLIIDGERRYRAAKSIDLQTVPAIVYDEMSFADRTIKRFNLQETHSNWSNFDKARAIMILKEELGIDSYELADMLGLAPRTVDGYLSLLNLSKRTMEYSSKKKLPLTYLTELGYLCKLFDTKKEKEQIEKAILDKIENGTIVHYKNIRDYRTSIRRDEKDILDKILTNDEYSSKKAQQDSGVYYVKKIKWVISQFGYATRVIQEYLKSGEEFKELDVKKIEKYIQALQKLIK